jgi:hypothetical protein
MKLFSYTFIGKAKEWFDNIPPGTVRNWSLFQETFTKRFEKKRDYQSLCNQLHNCERGTEEDIWDFNDRCNTLIRCFPQDLKPPLVAILKLYISTMKDPYRGLIRERPTTLFEARKRACEIEENLATSFIQGQEDPKKDL